MNLLVFAAYRAVESREHAALFQDPLAEAMAGESAMEQVSLARLACHPET